MYGKLSDPILIEKGVKQGSIPAPTLFALYFAIVFLMAFEGYLFRIYIKYWTMNRMLTIKEFAAKKTKLFSLLVYEFLCAGGYDFKCTFSEWYT